MRVIAGVYRSRLLTAPPGLATRPTSDRLRETLFNVLSARVEGAVFADLYAGSGAVGIEAISRGARMVYFVDQAPAAGAAIRANLASLEIKRGFKIESVSVAGGMRRLEERCSIVFLDPPYEAEEEYAKTLGGIGARADTLLTEGGIVVVEHSKKMQTGEKIGPLERYRVLTQGDAGLSFYRQSA